MIYLGTDHAGFQLKELAKSYLLSKEIEVIDCGALHFDHGDDYPDYGFAVAEEVARGRGEGILFCESAGGMTICANKVKGIRAVECSTVEEVVHAKQHNKANILVISKMNVIDGNLPKLIDAWLTTSFSNEERHVRRLEKIAAFEQEHWK